MADLFISYAREDRPRIEALVAWLESRGLSVWWDRDLKGGTVFSARIEEEIRAAGAVLVVWSPHSLTSRWVADEAELALEEKKLVPLTLEGTQPPMGFRQLHTIAFDDWQGEPEASCLKDLEAAIEPLKGDAPKTGREQEAASPFAANTIAVLPFVNMSSDPEQDYFSDGIAEELLNLLAKISELKVTSRTSSFALKGTARQVEEIGRLFGVANVLEGSVRKAGNRVRITAQLIETQSGFHLWSETYDRTLDDIFAVQDEIAAAIVEALKAHVLGPKDLEAPSLDYKPDIKAYDHYLKGHFLIQGTNFDVIDKGLTELREAIRLDPAFALPYIDVGDALAQLTTYGHYQTAEILAEARDAAFTAVKLAPDMAEAHSAIASVYQFVTLDWKAADVAYEKAISLASQSAMPYHRYAEYLWMTVRIQKACDMARRAIDIDPLDGNAMHAVGITSLFAGDFSASAEAFGKWNSLYPDSLWSYIKHAVALSYAGEADQSLAQLEKVRSLSPGPIGPLGESWIGWAHFISGRRPEFEASRTRILTSEADPSDIEVALFWVHALVGDDAALLNLLKRMKAARHPHMIIAKVPLVEDLRFSVAAKLRENHDYQAHLQALDLPPGDVD